MNEETTKDPVMKRAILVTRKIGAQWEAVLLIDGLLIKTFQDESLMTVVVKGYEGFFSFPHPDGTRVNLILETGLPND